MRKIEHFAIILIVLWVLSMPASWYFGVYIVPRYVHPDQLPYISYLTRFMAYGSFLIGKVVDIGIAIWLFKIARQGKERPGIWALLGLFGGVFAVLLLYVLRSYEVLVIMKNCNCEPSTPPNPRSPSAPVLVGADVREKRTMNTKIRFQEIASRITGISIPVFGVSWNPPVSERKIVREVLVFLEDRRALYNDYAHEIEDQVTTSVLEMRKNLTDAIQKLPDESNAVPRLRAMRAACREYLDCKDRHFQPSFMFLTALGRLRSLCGVNVAYLAVEYGVNIEGELASIVPPEFKKEPDPEPVGVDNAAARHV